MEKIRKLQEQKKALEMQLREVNFKLRNEPENRNKYVIPREIFKLKRQKKIKEIEIEQINNKIKKLKERDV